VPLGGIGFNVHLEPVAGGYKASVIVPKPRFFW